jgi:response regulator RpfG family c-di-GMP phosphodiesterase
MSAERLVVLIVDDEAKVGTSIERVLRGEDLRILTAQSGLHALQILEREPVDIVISDQVRPGMDGVLFLETVRDRWPHTVRALLTAHASPDVFAAAVNRGGVHKIMQKPLRADQIRSALAELVNERLARR